MESLGRVEVAIMMEEVGCWLVRGVRRVGCLPYFP
jgi:hypothetical protein